jgi:predicted anti-sigma-YlaC factor YlaD
VVAALWPERCRGLVSVSGYLIGSQAVMISQHEAVAGVILTAAATVGQLTAITG